MAKCYASKVISVAEAEIGYHEKASNSNLDSKTGNSGSANYTRYANEIDSKYPDFYNGRKNGYAWCDLFVDWCFISAYGLSDALRLLCQPTKSAGAGCTYSLQYYRNKGQYYARGNTPKIGDQIFFGSGTSNVEHTGIVYAVDASKVYTIEGNTSDQVARRSYALNNSRIVGYGRPKYDAEESGGTSPAPSTPTTPSTGSGTITKGSKVRVKQGAKTYNGGGLASFVYNRDHIVSELKGDRAVITYGGVVVAAVKVADLVLV